MTETKRISFIDRAGGWGALVRTLIGKPRKRTETPNERAIRKAKIDDFIDNFLLPDMAARGVGFGRTAAANFFRSVGVGSFVMLDTIPISVLNRLADAPGVGPAVLKSTLQYLIERGRYELLPTPVAEPVDDGAVEKVVDDGEARSGD